MKDYLEEAIFKARSDFDNSYKKGILCALISMAQDLKDIKKILAEEKLEEIENKQLEFNFKEKSYGK